MSSPILFCSTPVLRPKAPPARHGMAPPIGLEAVVTDAAVWTGQRELRIGFIDPAPDPRYVDLVRQHAVEWTRHANLDFTFLNSPVEHPDIAITFHGPARRAFSSLVGNEARAFQPPSMTLTFDDQMLGTPAECRRLILHEFGHALGFNHEHQHPQNPIQWNEQQVIADLAQIGWSATMVRQQVFQRLNNSLHRYTTSQFDPKSIMLYAVRPGWAFNFQSEDNYELSDEDIAMAKRFYPGRTTGGGGSSTTGRRDLATDGTSLSGTLDSAVRRNEYVVRVSQPALYRIETAGSIDLRMELFDLANAATRLDLTDGTRGDNPSMVRFFDAGSYLVAIGPTPVTPNAAGSYQIFARRIEA